MRRARVRGWRSVVLSERDHWTVVQVLRQPADVGTHRFAVARTIAESNGKTIRVAEYTAIDVSDAVSNSVALNHANREPDKLPVRVAECRAVRVAHNLSDNGSGGSLQGGRTA